MTKSSRQTVLECLAAEQAALMDLLSGISDKEWRTLTRNDGWSIHDIVAHIADFYLTTLATSGVSASVSTTDVGTTLPMLPGGRINIERLNMMRYERNRQLSRADVMARLSRALEAFSATVRDMSDERLTGPGPYGPPETMLDFLRGAVLHDQAHHREIERICVGHAKP